MGLARGSYTVTIRERNSEGCNVSEQVIIGVRDIPEIESVQESPTSNCNEFDGKLSISANGTGLEYSIDGGTTYSSQKDFEGLGEGTYFSFVRSGSSSECVASTIAEISDQQECVILRSGINEVIIKVLKQE